MHFPITISPEFATPEPAAAHYPATERQKASWKEYAESGKRRIQNTNTIFDMETPDMTFVENTVRSLLDRHDALRTTFVLTNECLQQVVHHPKKKIIATEQSYCRGFFAGKKLRSAIARVLQTYFDLEKGPLIRVVLFHLDNNRTKVVIVAQHIISDAVSIQILKDEFLSFYESFKTCGVIDRPPLTYQLKDFALWEQQYIKGPQGCQNQLYWLDQLHNGLSKYEVLKTWRPKKKLLAFNQKSNSGEYVAFVPQSLLGKIKAYVRDIKSSKLCFFYATLFCLLHKLSNHMEMAIIVPISLRDRRELQPMIGYLTTDIYLKMRLDETLSLQEMMTMASQKYFSALDHRHHQIDKVQSIGRRYCAAVLNELPPRNEAIKNLKARFITKNNGINTPFPIFLMLTECNNGLQINCIYNNEILNSGSIPTIFDMYLTLLDFAVNNPSHSVSHLLSKLSEHLTK